MYNEKDILNKCQEFAKLYFNMEFNEIIRISKRMTKTMGQCTAMVTRQGDKILKVVIEELAFSHKFFQNDEYSNDILDKIIKHELTHWYFFKQNKDNKHNAEFKALCLKIGGDLGYTNCEIEVKDTETQYVILCSRCGEVTALRKRTPSDKLLYGKISGCCKATLVNAGQHEIRSDICEQQFQKIKAAYISKLNK